MVIKNAFEQLKQDLIGIYDEREAYNITIIVFEDAFDEKKAQTQTKSLNLDQQKQLKAIRQRLLKSEPWQYVLGEADFYGLKFDVNSSVLIPRAETEELVYWIKEDYKKNPNFSILDIGTGSGCIAVTLKHLLKQATVSAIDVDSSALDTATKNAQKYSLDIEWILDDILAPKHQYPKYDIIVSNPPYIMPTEGQQMKANVMLHEPSLALFVNNNDPLQFYKTIAKFGEQHLQDNGRIYFELSAVYAEATQAYFEQEGYWKTELKQDMQGRGRMLLLYR